MRDHSSRLILYEKPAPLPGSSCMSQDSPRRQGRNRARMKIAVSLHQYLTESARLPDLDAQSWSEQLVANAISTVVCALGEGKPLLVCGNGGSACDAMHLTGELVGRFLRDRRPLNAICLTPNSALVTAWANDYSYDTVFSRQTEAYGQPGGVLLGISTSGTSKNVVAACEQARSMGMRTIALTGEGGGALAP